MHMYAYNKIMLRRHGMHWKDINKTKQNNYIFVSIIDKNNRHLSGYDQISFIGDDVRK